MKFFKKVFFLTLFFLFGMAVVFTEPSVPKAVSGVLDLSGDDLCDLIMLEGEWTCKLEEIDGMPVEKEESVFLQVPGSWNEITGTPYAAGEYSLRIILPAEAPEMGALIFPELSQILYAELNGQEILSSGDFETGVTDYTRLMLPVSLNPEMELTVRLKNTKFRSGGLLYLPMFGTRRNVRNFRESNIWMEALYIGVLFLASIYHIFLYLKDYNSISSLYLGIAALLMLIRGFVTGENTIAFLVPGFPWELDYRIEYITAYLNAAFLLLFCNRTFPFNVRLITNLEKIVVVLCISFSVMTGFLPIRILSRTIWLLQGTMMFSFIVGLLIYSHALWSRAKSSLLFFIGGTILLVSAIVDSSYYLCVTSKLLNISQFGMLFFIIIQTFVLSRLYGDAFLRAEALTHFLEEEVAKQTAELKETNLSLREEVFYRKKMEERLQLLSTTDPLTGAANRLKINKDLEQAFQVFQRYGNSFGLVMFDVDHFKEVNDRFGHDAGDMVLKDIVGIALDVIRESDILSRWGGEEFVILMPMLELEGAAAAAERIRSAFEKHDFHPAGRVTASFSVVVPVNKEESLNQLLVRLDEKLYEAKRAGRNSVIS